MCLGGEGDHVVGPALEPALQGRAVHLGQDKLVRGLSMGAVT